MEPELRKAPIRFYEIDLLRFLAALSVVFYHYTYRGYMEGKYSPLAFPALGHYTRYGYLGVELFFIVSGYVVLLSVQGKTIRQFFVSRVIRLYPAFWVACTLTFLVKYFCGPGPGDQQMSPLLHAGIFQYLLNLTMFHEFFGVAAMDGAYWSLTVEITFYFLISLLIGYKLMRHIDWCLALWLAYAALPSMLHTGGRFDSLFIPNGAPYFAAGMLFYLLQQPVGRTWQRYALLLASYLLALRSAINHKNELDSYFHEASSHVVVGVIISLFFILFFLISFRKIDLSKFRWLMWMGGLTYPLYLLHSDIGFIIFFRFEHLLPKYWLLGGTLLLMLVGAYLVHAFIEKRFSRQLGQKLTHWLSRFDAADTLPQAK